jgi:hypothetical protein
MFKKILILGNGFDLDFGLKSRYRDFMNSQIWKRAKDENDFATFGIVNYLEEKNKLESWFDVETELLNYALEITEGTYRSPQESDRKAFEFFQAKLKEYLQKEQYSLERPKVSTAMAMFNNILANGYFTNIYTFNYTDVSKFMAKYNIKVDIPITFMHGSLEKYDNIVLGIETDKKIHPNYKFLFKTNSRYYTSNNLIESLDDANEIVFFGHSINGMDFPYFKDFFKKQSQPSKDFKRKKITIFTYDLASEEKIRDNFREEGINLRELMSRNDLTFIETKLLNVGDEHEEYKFDGFLAHLEEDSKDAENETIHRLEQDLL